MTLPFMINYERWSEVRVNGSIGMTLNGKSVRKVNLDKEPGDVQFQLLEEDKYNRNGFYRTFWGASPWHNGIIYDGLNRGYGRRSANRNLLVASSLRLLGYKDADQDRARRLRGNQGRLLKSRTMRRALDKLQKHIDRYLSDKLMASYHEELVKYANKAHLKKKERLLFLSIMESEGLSEIADHIGKDWECFVKTKEFAKFGKVPRAVATGGIKCMVIGFVAEHIKCALSTFRMHGKHQFRFITKPDQQDLRENFENIVTNKFGVKMIAFSDDSCVSVVNEYISAYGNADISACDASHTEVVFKLLEEIVIQSIFKKIIIAGIEQLREKVKIKFSNGSITMTLKEPALETGSGLTTIVNVLANFTNFIALVENFMRITGLDKIKVSMEASGYMMTFEVSTHPSGLTFLKHFPCNENYEPALCLGVIARTVGSCKGDVQLSKTISLEEKFQAHMSGVVRGLCYAGDSIVMRALAERYNSPNYVESNDSYWRDEYNKSALYNPKVDMNFICKRYNLTELDVEELASKFKTTPFGTVFRCRASARCLEVAYGFDSLDRKSVV